jgi:hypothetical protein
MITPYCIIPSVQRQKLRRPDAKTGRGPAAAAASNLCYIRNPPDLRVSGPIFFLSKKETGLNSLEAMVAGLIRKDLRRQ